MGDIKQINNKNWKLFLQKHNWSQKLWCKGVKNWQKPIQKHLYLQH